MKETLVAVQNNQVITDSRKVAEYFEKRHDHVIRDIELYKKDAPNFGEMFFETTMPDTYGREQKVYLMNRDGFSLLAMSFTGAKALEWKLKFLKAFNAMEKKLKEVQVPTDYLSALKALVASEEEKALMKPKADYYDECMDSTKALTTTQVAKELGYSKAQKLNDILESRGILYRVGYKSDSRKVKSAYPLMPRVTYQFLIDDGYVVVITTPFNHYIKWTNKGVKWLKDLLTNW